MDSSFLVLLVFQTITIVLVMVVGLMAVINYMNVHHLMVHFDLDEFEEDEDEGHRLLDDGVTPGATPLNNDGTLKAEDWTPYNRLR